MNIIYLVELTLHGAECQSFPGEIGHNRDTAIFTCYVRLVGIVPKFD